MFFDLIFFFNFSFLSQNSPDVVCLGENKICDSSKRMCVKAEQLYNSTNQLNKYIRGMSSSAESFHDMVQEGF